MILGSVGMIVGALVAISAQRYPPHQPKLERCAAGCFVGGIALIAVAFPTI